MGGKEIVVCAAGMRIDCIAILAALMQHCPEGLSYEAIEALHHVSQPQASLRLIAPLDSNLLVA